VYLNKVESASRDPLGQTI
jgi:hypothetical protein